MEPLVQCAVLELIESITSIIVQLCYSDNGVYVAVEV